MKNHDKVQNLAHWLNHGAMLVNKSKKHFTPCEKATEIIKNSELPFMQSLAIANNTICHCHNSITIDDMINLAFDDRARKAHYTRKEV